jgi:hypothetical protein
MSDREWLLLAAGLVIGVPVGMVLFWFLSKHVGSEGLFASKTYSNLEEWEFIRDPSTGRTKGLKVKRTAKEAV